MNTDSLGNIIHSESDLLNLLYEDRADVFDRLLLEDTKSIQQFKELAELNLRILDNAIYSIDKEDFDKICQDDWFMPNEYKNMDIEGFLVNQCPKEHYARLIEELEEFRSRNMLPLLRVLKYIVDTLRTNNVLWGVGRGSSVASYVLFLLGVHKIDSIKYNLDWREFLR
jgi:DNA polymerase III alpha subunit